MKPSEITAELLRKYFVYSPKTGAITRRADGTNAVYVKRRGSKNAFAVVSVHSNGVLATRVIYALENKRLPVGLRTRFADGDPTNLRRSNMTFYVNETGQPGAARTLARILAAMEKLGGRASTPMLREVIGCEMKTPLSAYMKLLQAKGQAHICGIDAEHTQATGHKTLMWALGPGDDEEIPEDAKRFVAEMRSRRVGAEEPDLDALDAEAARRRAKQSVAAARAGMIPNSVFAVAAQLM